MLDPNTFLLNSLNTLYLQGKQRRPALAVWGRIILTLLCPLVVLDLGLGVVALTDWFQTEQLYSQGEAVQATVLERQILRDQQGRPRYLVTYRFALGAADYRNSSFVDGTVYATLGPNTSMIVRYLPATPAVSEIAKSWPWLRPILLTAGVIVLRSLLTLALKASRRLARREWLLRTYGQPLQGTIVQAHGKLQADGNWLLELHYHFTTPEGLLIQQTTTRICNHLRTTQHVPAPGTPLGIWYTAPHLFVLL